MYIYIYMYVYVYIYIYIYIYINIILGDLVATELRVLNVNTEQIWTNNS